KEIKDIIAFFRIVVNSWDNEALKRIINIPSRGIGQTTVGRLEETAVGMELPIWKILEELPGKNIAGFNKGVISRLGQFVEMIRGFMEVAKECDAFATAVAIAEKTGILKELSADKSPESVSRHENIQELLNAIKEFSLNALEEGASGKLSDYLENISLLTDQDTDKDDDRDKVTLMTVHSAKGLEFKNVFIVGLEEELFPSLQQNMKRRAEAIEEERRLFYVALTRAEENVWLSYANQRYRWGRPSRCIPSRFLTELDKKFLEGLNIDKYGSSSNKRESYQTPSGIYRSEIFRNKINNIKYAETTDKNFKGDDPGKIVQGMIVEHQKFGTGKVLKVEGVSSDKKVFVFFQNAGNKQLLLKFAKLKIIG
ncbi:MAG: ATP-binding domain-containing protein, partial [Bacteroidales bacterium]|nr:ATP-binding domain-containing protein [Bacteroidales bacterium]